MDGSDSKETVGRLNIGVEVMNSGDGGGTEV